MISPLLVTGLIVPEIHQLPRLELSIVRLSTEITRGGGDARFCVDCSRGQETFVDMKRRAACLMCQYSGLHLL